MLFNLTVDEGGKNRISGPRKIIHLDLDAFFCAVEEQYTPSLRDKPFAVGGRPEDRGVVASCSYTARTHGVHSAMPMARAVKLCPGLVIVSSRHGDYERISNEVMRTLTNLTPLVEQVSIDEAFLDVSSSHKSGARIARDLQNSILETFKLPNSLGVASNKRVAKIANNIGKSAAKTAGPPNAIMVVPSGQEAAFLAPLPVRALWGVGPKTADLLKGRGIRIVQDLLEVSEAELVRVLGVYGSSLKQHARGIDDSVVEADRETRSVSKETTFAQDVGDPEVLHATLRSLSEGVGRGLRNEGLTCRTISLKYRLPDFSTLSRQMTLKTPTNLDTPIYDCVKQLLKQVWHPDQRVRLLGVSASRLGPEERQLTLWESDAERDERLQKTLDSLRDKFGLSAVRWGKSLKGED